MLFRSELEREKEVTYAAAPVQIPSPVITNMPAVTTEVNVNAENTKITKGHEMIAPLVGTFSISSVPCKEPFVKIGSKVKKGDTICIIEAMKLMNEVEADVDGTVVEILADNESMVEFGQPLFVIA